MNTGFHFSEMLSLKYILCGFLLMLVLGSCQKSEAIHNPSGGNQTSEGSDSSSFKDSSSSSPTAKSIAFPGAQGGGMYASGGRGGSVYEVTNLKDHGPGSLRDAVSDSNRTVVFRVSGIIRLERALKITKNNITIAGQTAPGDGICIANYTLSIQASNIIVRYLRCRLGDQDKDENDAMHAVGKYKNGRFPFQYNNIIIDHCSLSWSIDEVGTFYGIGHFTLQWCILSESLYNSVHEKGIHGYGGIWGGYMATFHHNLLADNSSRNPRFGGSRYTGLPEKEKVDFRNNVIFNWGDINSAYGGEGGYYNMVNNYYKPGPATPGGSSASSTNLRNRILNYTSYYYSSDATVYPDTLFGGKFYISGNYIYGYPNATTHNWKYGVQKDGYKNAAQLIQKARFSPVEHAPVRTQSAQDAYHAVLDSVGAVLPKRDAVDERIIKQVKNGKGFGYSNTYPSPKKEQQNMSQPYGIIDSQDDIGGYPDYNTYNKQTDSDHDGMPDKWEEAHGLDPNDPSDRNGHEVSNNFYTNLESYLNSIK